MVQFYPWFKFSFLLFQTHYHVIIIHYHTQKQKKRKFEPRIKLNHNSYTRMNPYTAISRKVVGKMCTRQSRKVIWDMINTLFLMTVAVESTFAAFHWHSRTDVRGLSCHSFKFLWRTGQTKPPTIPFGIVACTFSYNLSRNSCISFFSKIQLVVYYQCCVLIG